MPVSEPTFAHDLKEVEMQPFAHNANVALYEKADRRERA
jgi:hypothetical protein